jgi:hypothetical protein
VLVVAGGNRDEHVKRKWGSLSLRLLFVTRH